MKKTNNTKKGRGKAPVHPAEIITAKTIEFIETHGILPWRQPWMITNKERGLSPCNIVTGTVYSGVNMMNCLMYGFESPYWISLKDANARGGRIIKGSSGVPIIHSKPGNWAMIRQIKEDPLLTQEEKDKAVAGYLPHLRLVGYVYNQEQVNGLEWPTPEQVAPVTFVPIEEAERVIRGIPNPPKIRMNGRKAYYSTGADTVVIPPRESFTTERGRVSGSLPRTRAQYGPRVSSGQVRGREGFDVRL